MNILLKLEDIFKSASKEDIKNRKTERAELFKKQYLEFKAKLQKKVTSSPKTWIAQQLPHYGHFGKEDKITGGVGRGGFHLDIIYSTVSLSYDGDDDFYTVDYNKENVLTYAGIQEDTIIDRIIYFIETGKVPGDQI
jgi:hypothetical protein